VASLVRDEKGLYREQYQAQELDPSPQSRALRVSAETKGAPPWQRHGEQLDHECRRSERPQFQADDPEQPRIELPTCSNVWTSTPGSGMSASHHAPSAMANVAANGFDTAPPTGRMPASYPVTVHLFLREAVGQRSVHTVALSAAIPTAAAFRARLSFFLLFSICVAARRAADLPRIAVAISVRWQNQRDEKG
jgi:hypothetical protein